MSTKKRNLIIFQPTDFVFETAEILKECEWNLHIASDIYQASNIMNGQNINVGLAIISQCNENQFLAELSKVLRSFSGIHWVMVLSSECIQDVTSYSTKTGLIIEYCCDYLTLPIEMDRLMFSLDHADRMAKINAAQKRIANPPIDYQIIGDSPEMESLFRHIAKVTGENSCVLIEGETGTGKELVANAIHSNSSRSKHPLITLNCGAFPKDLIQAELFGYEKGAFTGAQHQKTGLIEAAQGGTLFLDEIGDLPLQLQVNLLRFLQERKIVRIGSVSEIPVDVRVIAATHVDLREAVKQGTFREDLYYRLRILQLHTPPLRERGSDIDLLAWHYFNKFTGQQNKYKAKGFSSDAIHLLKQYNWPGNVRELMNCIQQAVVMSENRLLTPTDLKLERRNRHRAFQTLEQARVTEIGRAHV